MVRDLYNNVFSLFTLMTLLLCGCAKQEPAEKSKPESSAQTSDKTSPLTGQWHSVKMEGEDIGNFIKEIRYTFRTDGSFDARAYMSDGSADKKQGTFQIHGNQILQVIDGKSLNRKYEFQNGTLIIHDPFLDTSIWLERNSNSVE